MAEVYNAGNADTENIKTEVMGGTGEEMVNSLNDFLSGVSGTFSTTVSEGGADKKAENPDVSTLKVDEDGITEYVTPDMLIGDIITWYPDASLVLMKCGMHCISCGVSQFETLDQACAVHGLYTDDVAKVVNDYLTQTLGGKAQQEADAKDEQ